MKYLKYYPDATDLSSLTNDLYYNWRRPSVIYVPKIGDLSDISKYYASYGATASSNLIYKGGGITFNTTQYTEEGYKPYNMFRITANGNIFNDDDDKGMHKITGSFDKLTIESCQFKSELTDYNGLVLLYNIQDYMTAIGGAEILTYPQCLYDYLSDNSITKEEFESILKGTDATAITNLQNACLEKGFYPVYNNILYCYVRGDMGQIYPEVNDGNLIGIWMISSFYSYNPSTKEVKPI